MQAGVTLLTRPAGNAAGHTAAAGHLCRTVLATFTDLAGTPKGKLLPGRMSAPWPLIT